MKNIRDYIYNALKESINTCDKNEPDYYFQELKAEDYCFT